MIAEVREIILGLGFLLLSLTSETDATADLDLFCLFNGQRYNPGDSWHPYLEPHGVMYCIKCTCFEDTNVSCYQIQCPLLPCPNPIMEPQQCCGRCPEFYSQPGLEEPVDSSCEYNGATYQNGDMFTASELFPSKQSNQCTQCSCSEGQIYCGLVTCPELFCASPQNIPDSCCPVCRDNSYDSLTEEEPLQLNGHSREQCAGETRSEAADMPTGASLEFAPNSGKQRGGGTTVKIILKERHKRACAYNGKTYSHGEVWHPTFRYFVPLPCILCTCQDGIQDCQKVVCPREYPCDEPQHVEGKCCKVCPGDEMIPTTAVNTNKCRVSIYMFIASSAEKENLRKIAIEKDSSDYVEIYIWKLVKGVFHLVQIQKVNKLEFRQEVQNFRMLSQTNEAYWNAFLVQGPEVKLSEGPDKEMRNL
uniref:chordin-like protein 2 n=1 Tax=Euleptes europaea TaxID=460621 RepID=UPI0025403907|nr:chordin-like protein 2 [Euleptes europaea]